MKEKKRGPSRVKKKMEGWLPEKKKNGEKGKEKNRRGRRREKQLLLRVHKEGEI